MKNILSCLGLLAFITSCSLVNKVAVKTTGSVIVAGSDELLTEGNWHYFEKSVPANLKLMEGLWFSDQGNKDLLTSLVKGFGAHAFAINETKALQDILEDNTEAFSIQQTLLHYEKSIFYGFEYLKHAGISKEEFLDKSFPMKLKERFDSTFSSDDYIAILYFAQSLGSSINIQRENVAKLGYFNHVKSMLSWVCEKDPDIERGSCYLFDAVIEASTSGVLGGSMDKAQEKFQEVIKKQPYNLLARVAYIQYYIIPMLEEDEFSAMMQLLSKDINTWFQLQLGNPSEASQLFEKHREFNLFNSIAKERFTRIHKLRKNIFD